MRKILKKFNKRNEKTNFELYVNLSKKAILVFWRPVFYSCFAGDIGWTRMIHKSLNCEMQKLGNEKG